MLQVIPAGTSTDLRTIILEVAHKHNVTVAELLSERRARPLAWARQEGYWRAYRETPASLPRIARAFRRADHSTVWHGVRAHRARLEAQMNELEAAGQMTLGFDAGPKAPVPLQSESRAAAADPRVRSTPVPNLGPLATSS